MSLQIKLFILKSMLNAKNSFDNSNERVKKIHELYIHLKNELHFNSDFIDDLLRSEIVYIVSALDKFIHDIVKVGILESFNGLRTNTSAYNGFSISMLQFNSLANPLTPSISSQILENIIVENHKHLSFQDPDKISQALSLIWTENHKWKKIADYLGVDEKNLKVELRNIIIRRNQIVHEADMDLFTNTIQEINSADVENSTIFIADLIDAIYNLVKV